MEIKVFTLGHRQVGDTASRGVDRNSGSCLDIAARVVKYCIDAPQQRWPRLL
jgi:hypothetical protein